MNTNTTCPRAAAILLAGLMTFAVPPSRGQAPPATGEPAGLPAPAAASEEPVPQEKAIPGLPAAGAGRVPGGPPIGVPAPPQPAATPAPAANLPSLPPAPAAGAPYPAPPPGATVAPNLPPSTPRKIRAHNYGRTPAEEMAPPVPVPSADARNEKRMSRSGAASGGTWMQAAPAPAATADQILRDTKLKVLQRHYETALSEALEAERAQLTAAPEQRETLAAKCKALHGFADRLADDIRKLTEARSTGTTSPAFGDPLVPGNSSRTRGPRVAGRVGDTPYAPARATGAPDAKNNGGDSPSAWCPASASGEEWLKLSYPRRVEVAEVRIHENYATGALTRVMALDTADDGKRIGEHVMWEETEPKENPPCVRIIAGPPGVTANGIRLEFDTRRIQTWQEIDAMELVGRDGSRQWASGAEASSHWGYGRPMVWEGPDVYRAEGRGPAYARVPDDHGDSGDPSLLTPPVADAPPVADDPFDAGGGATATPEPRQR